MPKTILTPGIITRTNIQGESNLVGTLISPIIGKVSFFARGARASSKRLTGGIEALDSAVFQLSPPARGRDLYILESISQRENLSNLRNSMMSFSFACLGLEIISHTTAENDRDSVNFYSLLHTYLFDLNAATSPDDSQKALLAFLINNLKLAGIDPLAHEQFLIAYSSILPHEPGDPTPTWSVFKKLILQLLDFSEHHSSFRLRTRPDVEKQLLRLENLSR